MKPNFEILPALLTACGVLILCTLGTWQVQRLEWKQGLLAALAESYAGDAQILSASDLSQNFDFRRGRLEGTLLTDHAVALTPRPRDGAIGQDIFVPLALEDGSHIVVNIGWAPLDWSLEKLHESRQKAAPITALIKRPPRRNMFSPSGEMDAKTVHFLDLQALQKSWGIAGLRPYVAIAEDPVFAGQTPYPKTYAERPELNNNHAYYAAFWYSMAIVMLIMYVLRFHVKKLS